MSFETWLSFSAVAILIVLSPGPALLMVMRYGTQFGARRALFPILGNITGLAILITASAIGVGSVLDASSEAFFWVRLVGGLYLIYLGFKLLRSGPVNVEDEPHNKAVPSSLKAYLQGVMVALSNPKALLFIGALFPQFLDASQPIFMQLAVLGLTLMVMSFTVLMTCAAVSKKLVSKGRKGLFGKVNKITGTLFVLFGMTLAAGSR